MADSVNIPDRADSSPDAIVDSNAVMPYHIPALLDESIEALDIQPSGVYADATFGGGGHSRAILEKLGPDGHLYGFDQDRDAIQNIPDDKRFTFILSNFKYMKNFMRFEGVDLFDGIIADLGVSFHHFDDAMRGFSFREDAPLDMRMNRNAQFKASDYIEQFSETDLISMLLSYTDLRKSARNIAQTICHARGKEPITSTRQLAEVVKPCLNPKSEKKELAQIFQALRITVNNEMRALEDLLQAAPSMLRPGGRIAILTYHSIEDRIVKNFFRSGNIDGNEEKDFYGVISSPWKLLTRSPIVPTPEEVERNPRSRSAKLRIAQLK